MKTALYVLALSLIGLLAPRQALAASVSDCLAKISTGELEQVRAGIADLGASPDERALLVLLAIETKRLRFDKSGLAYIKVDDHYVDAISGESKAPTGELEQPTVSNVVRRALAPAIAQLRLRSQDYDTRLEAASELSRRPSEDLLDTMRQVAGAERDPTIRNFLRLGIAQIDMESGDIERQLGAMATIADEGDISHRGQLESLLSQHEQAAEGSPQAELHAAANRALQAIDRRAMFVNWIANIFYGVSLGSVLLLAALGLAITFGLMKVINMAHGEMLMIGAYTTFVVQNFFGEELVDYYLIAAVPAAFVASGLVGMLLERLVIRYLYGRPLETLLATWGISLLLIQTVRLMFGAQNVTVSNPSWLSGGFELMPTIVLPYSRLATILFVVVVVSFVWFLLRRTRLGLYVRAVQQNREMAGNMGVPTKQIDMWTFALGSGVAGLGGVALSQLGNVGPELGQGYIVDSFMVVVLGGVGNIVGTIVGALGLGMVNKFLEPVAGAVLGKIVILVLIVLFIQKRPQGLFALKGRAAEL